MIMMRSLEFLVMAPLLMSTWCSTDLVVAAEEDAGYDVGGGGSVHLTSRSNSSSSSSEYYR